MKHFFYLTLFVFSSQLLSAQSIDAPFSQKKMQKDLAIFKTIRQKANSGFYKYRTETQIDSIYLWAENQIAHSKSYLDFYNILSHLNDFEGSLHNDVSLPEKYS